MRTTRRHSRGQGMTETIIMVALVAVASIAGVTLFGDNLRGLFGASAEAVAGEEACNPGTSDTGETHGRTLANFGDVSAGGNGGGNPGGACDGTSKGTGGGSGNGKN
jgi:pilus assembly protein Flp/PilA